MMAKNPRMRISLSNYVGDIMICIVDAHIVINKIEYYKKVFFLHDTKRYAMKKGMVIF